MIAPTAGGMVRRSECHQGLLLEAHIDVGEGSSSSSQLNFTPSWSASTADLLVMDFDKSADRLVAHVDGLLVSAFTQCDFLLSSATEIA